MEQNFKTQNDSLNHSIQYCIISLGWVSSQIRTVMMKAEFVSELSVYSSEITPLFAWEYIIKCHKNVASKYAVDYFVVSEESSWIGLGPVFLIGSKE